jgi:AP-1 complex subunit mu
VKPLIWVEAVVEPHSNSRIEYMIKTKSQYKSRSIANNVEIIIPVPRDVDTPSFKASIGAAQVPTVQHILSLLVHLWHCLI